ncbi:MAG: 50S ribosomal protein L30 [Hadesarchaea archaeon]|nr:50S ribosomal protein L30 [Hadesarchaea archaeon]
MVKLAVIRVRGGVRAREDVRSTLRMLGLTRVNHCVVIDEDPSLKGMLQKAKDYITWGEIGRDTLEDLLRKRGRLEGGKRLTDEYIKSNTRFQSIHEFVDAFYRGEVKLSDIPGLKKVFRLHPPKKGYEATKRPFKTGGSLGYRGVEINELVSRMI